MSKGDDENPFGDPSVQNAVSNPGNKVDLDDYNPFDGKTQIQSPAVMNPTEDLPPAEISAPQTVQQPKVSTADFQRRQDELEKRAQELDRREEELRSAPQNVRQNNWPPLPNFCPVQSCFYHDINVDIPVEFQKIVKHLYYLWVGHVSLLAANLLAGLLYLFTKGDMGGTFGLALVYCVLFTPASFVCWFRPAYKAFRDDSSINFMFFFFVFFFQMIVSALYSVGIGGMGSSGLWLGFEAIGRKDASGGLIFVGVLMVIIGVGWGLAALADFYLLAKIHRLYRSTGASIAKAQAEFTSGVMSNETVRQAAADAARESVRSQFAENNQTGNGNRY